MLLTASRWRRAPLTVMLFVVLALIVASTIAIGNALSDDTPDSIVLVVDDGPDYFQYGGSTNRQHIERGRSDCQVDPDANGADFIRVSHTAVNKQGREVVGYLGLVEDGIGVNAKGNGNGQDCGRVDHIEADTSETLTLELGTGVPDQMIEYIDFDFEAKFDAELIISFFRGSTSLGDQRVMLNTGSDSGPDSKFRDKYRVYAYPGAPNGQPEEDRPDAGDLTQSFNRVVLTMAAGAVSLEGGATWDEAEGDSADNHRTVFHLVSARTEIGVDLSTRYEVDGSYELVPTDLYIPATSPIRWDYVVTNEGDLPLSGVTVLDSVDGVNPQLVSGDDGDEILEVGETWLYQATGVATAGAYSNTANASGASEFGTASDEDSSGYFGSAPSLQLEADNNAVDGYIDVDDAAVVDYTVTNTGNVDLTGVTITDDHSGTVCTVGNLAEGQSSDCTGTTTVLRSGPHTNVGRANGTGPGVGGDPSEATATTSYFGSDPSFEVEISNNGVGEPPVVSESTVIWTITVRNTGNVEITVIAGAEDGTDRTCTFDDLQPQGEEGDTATCTIESPTNDGPVTTSFTVTGRDPIGTLVTVESGTVGYYGGLACGDSSSEGGEDVDDTPLAYFWVGPHKNGSTCAVPVIIETTNTTGTEGGEQTVNVAPPAGYPDSWDGVTGLVTIEWDVEVAVPEVLRATLQRVDDNDPSQDIPIPACTGPTAVGVTLGTSGFYELDPLAIYPEATDGADVCLVQHFFQTVTYDPDGTGPIESEVRTRSIEVFYIWNDPKFVRR